MTYDERRELAHVTRVSMAYNLERLGVAPKIILEAMVGAHVEDWTAEQLREQLDGWGLAGS